MKQSLALVAISILTFTTFPSMAKASETLVPDPKPDPAVSELREQLRNKKTPPVRYWVEGVAVCETGGDWQNGGNWAGGLGIAQSTWAGYGGRQFASSPAKATITEQIVIANRISVHGFQTKRQFRTLEDKQNNKPFFRPPVGFNGWGCVKHNNYLQPHVWRKNNRKK